MTAAEEEAERGFGEAGGERKRKKTLGRQKIEMKLIECLGARDVCFSKRRSGLFNKAAELAALCGAPVAVAVFSRAGKPYSFGHPSVHTVFGRCLDGPASAAVAGAAAAAGEAPVDPAMLREFGRERERLIKATEAEERRRKALDAATRAAGVRASDDVRGAAMPELLATLAALERIQAETATMQHCAAAGDRDAFHFPTAGAFAADGDASSSHQGVMDTQPMLMGGDVSHMPMPFAPPMMLPPYLPPPPGSYGSYQNHVAGYSHGYGYDDVGYGSDHGAVCEMEEYHGTTTPCNFFG